MTSLPLPVTHLEVLSVKGQRSTDQGVEDHTQTPHIHLWAVVLLPLKHTALTVGCVQSHRRTCDLCVSEVTWKSSGAAYGGDPQKVSSFPPTVNSLLKPKSAILIFMSASRRRFSACRGRSQSLVMRSMSAGKSELIGHSVFYLQVPVNYVLLMTVLNG